MTIDTEKPFDEMTPEELNKVMRQVKNTATKKKGKSPYSAPGIRLHGYLPAKMGDRFMICMDFAWKSGWIQKKREYNFVNWCVERIISSIEEEMSHNPNFPDLKDNQA